jgi:response regulator RpfG family c-di-GMP phosphodiesterase
MLTHTMRKNELLSSIPVILYSSTYDSKADAELAVRAGAVSFIKKPAPPQEILLAIREATKRGPHKAAEQTIPQELEVMKQYSSLLIQKLEDRNIELSRRNEELAHVNEEMQHFNKATVGREMMMIALKREVNALSIELGRKPPYDLSQLEEKK